MTSVGIVTRRHVRPQIGAPRGLEAAEEVLADRLACMVSSAHGLL